MNKIFNDLIDKYSEGNEQVVEHCERVGMFCYKFGKTIGLTSSDIDKLYTLGLLHDIGKLIAPKNIKAVQEQYPILAYTIIKMLDTDNQYEDIANILLDQLENYDGTGFPQQKTGDELHLFSMVVHISDFYDTMRSNGSTHEETTSAIREQTNIIFPKKIITPFIKMIITNNDLKTLYS